METIAEHCSWADTQLAEDTSLQLHLPVELRSLILASIGSGYLKALSIATRLPQCIDKLFLLYSPVIVDIINRWTAPSSQSLAESITTLSSLARILPFASYFKPYAKEVIESPLISDLLISGSPATVDVDEEQLYTLLLALFRLLSHDRDYFETSLRPTFSSSLLGHGSLRIRYLAIECLCMHMHFADAFCESLLHTYIGKVPILGKWEGKDIDFRLLKLWEEHRWKTFESEFESVQRLPPHIVYKQHRSLSESDLHSRTALVGNVLLPRTQHIPPSPTSFVLTENARTGLGLMGIALLERKPILVAGPASSGKSRLVMEAASLLGKDESMVTLHLNEQTDAKSLIGLHTSSPNDHTFVWQPGVLTRAMEQGRWVLIEDIDRAPAEVLGVLRPIIENGDLFIPSRKQRVKAADGFRILATVRSSASQTLRTFNRNAWLSNPRIWNMLHTESYSMPETSYLLLHRYPELANILESILQVHETIAALYETDVAFTAAQSRLPSLRDLLKWCRRVNKRVEIQNLRLSSQPVPDSFKIEVFKDAIDCYASHLSDDFLYNKVAASVAQSMNISPQQLQHYISGSLEPVYDTATAIRIGRTSLPKLATQRSRGLNTPFADTTSSRKCLESISAGIDFAEPFLLVGETGVGKTSLVQHIAALVGQKLTVINLSQQSEATDLIGGLKPVTTRSLVLPLVETFNPLFDDTFSASRNERFQVALSRALEKQNWTRLLKLWQEAMGMADTALNTSAKRTSVADTANTSKRRKLAASKHDSLRQRWTQFTDSVNRIRSQVERGDKSHTFSFVEGRLIQAVRNGEWVLLDEINLASSDTLDHIMSLLQDRDGRSPSVLLTEAGNVEKIIAHPDFKVLAAMNPATDTGKKDIAPGLRSRFTELYVNTGDKNLDDLVKLIQSYLGRLLDTDKRAAPALGRAYLDIQRLNQEHRLTDGAGDLPHFSIRSLVRCLLYTSQHCVSHGLRRAMYEGFAMSFFTVLSRDSEALVLPSMTSHILAHVKNIQSFLAQQPKIGPEGQNAIAFRHHLISKGPLTPDFQPNYIRTPSVERSLINLARAASMRRFPILLQGPTSAGKTSMVEYLAKLSGNNFVRINNHEHTDLQEYLGSYMSNSEGKLLFKDGVLVDALRQGHWLVLDELNLAPSDVLEALNRLLDDNRELLIPETQEVVRPHPNFLLFATQNPAGLYGGRKRLSRAFRNRFLEIHFDDIPEDELEVILRERAQIAPSFCTQIVAVYKKLSLQRQSSRLFEQRNSFATLRDLFRWASRPLDSREQLAHHGFMLLGERVRDSAERQIVKATIEETMKVKIDENTLYGPSAVPSDIHVADGIVWTRAMRRLFVLVSSALKNKEPVLLVGETGCGKTQICQVIAAAFGRFLNIYNAHTNTETGDLIGSQRPIRARSQLATDVVDSIRALSTIPIDSAEESVDQMITDFSQLDHSSFDSEKVQKVTLSIAAYRSLFEWSNGSLVRSMRNGEHFLLDEISLADDSVLERLNSVLEPARTLLLAEKGSIDNVVVAHADFQFLSTMNPGGDYGKRELSAALRNRLTEIWVPPLSEEDDVLPILTAKLNPELSFLASVMLRFSVWFKETIHGSATATIPLRDLLAWTRFVNCVPHLSPEHAFLNGAMMVYVDSVGANPAGMTASFFDLQSSRRTCLEFLQTLVSINVQMVYDEVPALNLSRDAVQVGSFSLPKLQHSQTDTPDLVFEAPTTLKNTMRLVRALQMDRPVLLEGSPGVGKTAIVTALAQLLGKSFTRINLSDQTDLMDLFGADAPAESEALGRFTWKNGPLLQAMQAGGWVLLDEMNLAPQSVLEGLNSCLDHRKEVYIAELDKTFSCHEDFKLFAAQNPHHQGGGRKGLPASFVNRFTVVYADSFTERDLLCICRTKYPTANQDAIEAVVQGVSRTDLLVSGSPAFGIGGPWEANLRDVDRWLQLSQLYPTLNPKYHFSSILEHRFRNTGQKTLLREQAVSNASEDAHESFYPRLGPSVLQVGLSFLHRHEKLQPQSSSTSIPVHHLPQAKSFITALAQAWPIILVGSSGAGKTQLVRSLAAAKGAKLVEVSMNAEIDTMDLLGGFEQYDQRREIEEIKEQALNLSEVNIQRWLSQNAARDTRPLLELFQVCKSSVPDARMLLSALDGFAEVGTAKALVQRLQMILDHSQEMQARFVWNDGVLVDAVREGHWLVLDNANLCNASVLDRLNSLLEPKGQLIISEQHNTDGRVRAIDPHPEFRIILTVDPRYGELSRAMRNRSLEIFLQVEALQEPAVRGARYPWTASISRLRDAFSDVESNDQAVCLVDNLPFDDLKTVQCQPLPQPDNTELALAVVQAAAGKHTGADTGIWLTLHELMQRFVTVEAPYQFGHGPLPQQLLLNEPLFSDAHESGSWQHINSLQRLWNIAQHLFQISSQIEGASTGSGTSALKRSARSSRTSNRGEHAVPPFFQFISTMFQSIREHVARLLRDPSLWDESKETMTITLYVKDVLDFAASANIDMAFFQVLLQIGQRLKQDLHHSHDLSGALALFKMTKLNRGLGLQRMWRDWKPRTPATLSQLESKLSFEKMMTKFDELAVSLPQTRAELTSVKARLLETAGSAWARQDADRVLHAMTQVMGPLQVHATRRRPVAAQFQDVFDAVSRRVAILNQMQTSTDTQLLETFSSTQELPSAPVVDGTPIQRAFTKLTAMRRHMNQDNVCDGHTLVQKLFSLTQQHLRHLFSIQEETRGLARLLSTNVSILSLDLLHSVRRQVAGLLSGILLAHHDHLSNQALACILSEGDIDLDGLLNLEASEILQSPVDDNEYFQSVFRSYLLPAIEFLNSETQISTGKALFHVSLAALVLMVPDKAFDPALFEHIVRERHIKRKQEVQAKIDSQKAFNQNLMGQDSSLTVRLLEGEMAELGYEPHATTVVRPRVSTLSHVQEEFSNILRTVIDGPPQLLLQQSLSSDQILKDSHRINQTADRLIARLGNLDRAYDDLVVPIVQLLQSLGLGASLIAFGLPQNHTVSQMNKMVAHVPLLGAKPKSTLGYPMKNAIGSSSSSLFWLESHVLQRSLERAASTGSTYHDKVEHLQVIDAFYEQWKTRLTTDQIEEEARSRYYAYRDEEGDDEAEMKELTEMFPSFDNDDEEREQSKSSYSGRDMAIRIADLHEQIFETGDNADGLRRFMLKALRKLESDSVSPNSSGLQDMMPGILLELEDQLQCVQGAANDTAINIYTDGSITEIQKLYKLVEASQARFYEIGDRWPEHAVPVEVISFSDELLDFKLDSPLAKLLTKAEKLLGIVAQWQSIASREFSVASLMDDLTTLIVSWRRLELASWSRLLNLEKQKNEEDARAWYFVAYEAVIYNSRRVVETGGDATEYSRELARTIEEFLRSTTQGQFVSRLRLLETLLQSLHEAAGLHAGLRPITESIRSIVAHYKRYVPNIEQTLQTGRADLEKAVVEQIKLASWKDTNITALRDSAKRSHQKLFKIVRKYRALLGKPIAMFKTEALDIDQEMSTTQLSLSEYENSQVPRALSECAAQIPDWRSRPARLQNPLASMSSLRHVYQTHLGEFDAIDELSSFHQELITTSKSLRKETPSNAKR